jgi:hypothetical protein
MSPFQSPDFIILDISLNRMKTLFKKAHLVIKFVITQFSDELLHLVRWNVLIVYNDFREGLLHVRFFGDGISNGFHTICHIRSNFDELTDYGKNILSDTTVHMTQSFKQSVPS